METFYWLTHKNVIKCWINYRLVIESLFLPSLLLEGFIKWQVKLDWKLFFCLYLEIECNLHKIFNKNTVMMSYCRAENLTSIIKSHNKKFINSSVKNTLPCNCRKKNE